jgi:hypothetical protein
VRSAAWKSTQNRIRPAAHSLRIPLPAAGRRAARDEETSPRPARASRVPRTRPQPGPGPGKSKPAWAGTRSGVCEPSVLIQRLREVSGRTKTRSGALAQTLIHFLSALSRSRRSGDSERPSGARESASEAPPEALTGERVHRWVSAPPSSASAALLFAAARRKATRRASRGLVGDEVSVPTTRRR